MTMQSQRRPNVLSCRRSSDRLYRCAEARLSTGSAHSTADVVANETRLCATTALNTASPNNVQTHCKLCPVQQLAARVGLKRFPPDAVGESNLNLGTSQSVAAPAELSAPVHGRAHPGYAGDRSLMSRSGWWRTTRQVLIGGTTLTGAPGRAPANGTGGRRRGGRDVRTHESSRYHLPPEAVGAIT